MFAFLRKKLHIKLRFLSSVFISSMAKFSLKNDSDYDGWDDNEKTVSSTRKAIMPATREMVDQLIASDTVVIFSKTKCPYCKMAKQVFDTLQKKYTAIELDEREDADEIQSILGEITGARTVPRVFVKGVCLGGGTDIKKLYDNGELESKF